MLRLRDCVFAILWLVVPAMAPAEDAVRVFAAASLTNALDDVAASWQAQGHPAAVLVYASSSALARQIEAGAHADQLQRRQAQRDRVRQRERGDHDPHRPPAPDGQHQTH